MRKVLSLIVISSLIFSWIYIIKNNKNSEINAIKLENKGDLFYEQGLYEDALDLYMKSIKEKNKNSLEEKIFNTNIMLENYDYIFNNKNLNLAKDKIIKEQSKILDSFIKNKEFKKYNKYIDYSVDEVRLDYKNKNIATFEVFDKSFSEINYLPYDKKIFPVKLNENDDSWVIVNENSKYINSNKFKDVLGVDNPNITVIEEGYTRVYGANNKLKLNLLGNNYFAYQAGKILKYEDDGYKYLDRSGLVLSEKYNYASNFNLDKAVVCKDICKLINNNFEQINSFEYKQIRSDARNNAIFDNKIIFITENEKYVVYDIEKNRYSKEYDDMDFSYGDYIAVKINGKWGYINKNFEKAIDFKYDYAKSFTKDVGVIKDKGIYYLINRDGEIVYTTDKKIFQFNQEGISFLGLNGDWKMIRLVREINGN